MFEWLGIVNPWLLAGAAGVASPILIHLLSKRRYKIVDWAAMNFLLEAERRNRRRIRIEHLLLLLLRCLIVLLIALLVSRLFIKGDSVPSLLGLTERTEHIVLLDDSPSMWQRVDNETVFDRTSGALVDFFKGAAEQSPGDTLTLLRTSEPDRPVVAGALLDQRLDEIVRSVDQLEPADRSAHLDQALLTLEKQIDEEEDAGGVLNRAVYVVTDLRQRDWAGSADAASEGSISAVLRRLSEKTGGVTIVDVGMDHAENLTVASITTQDQTIVAGVRSRFDVTVINHGPSEARDVRVTFTAGDAPPQTGYIDVIPPGRAGAVPFSFTFAGEGAVAVRAEVEPDALPVDNTRDHAVRVSEGVNVLIVDGDPSSEYGRSESFYLERAINPPGDRDSGNIVEVVTDSQFAGLTLDRYQAIFLCNVYQVPPDQRRLLREWVAQGGGLAVLLGDQVDHQLYNRQLGPEGTGLLPAVLKRIDGDDTERTWVTPGRVAANHPVMRIFSDANNPFIGRVKVFQWWGAEVLADDPDVSVIASMTDGDDAPLLLERRIDQGRVLMLTTSGDGAWTSWPADESYPVTMLEMVRYLARTGGAPVNIGVGQQLVWPLDVSRYRPEVTLSAPGSDEPSRVAAVNIGTQESEDETLTGPAEQTAAPQMAIVYDQTMRAGRYRVELEQFDGTTEPALFAVNIDPLEGNLTPAGQAALQQSLDDANVKLVRGEALLVNVGDSGRAEMWRWILIVLLGTLALEQTLAWAFGRRR